MQSAIYAIVNRTNGKVYVGSSKAIKGRKASHWHLLRKGTHGNPHLQAAWGKYGEAAFEFWVLEYCSEDDLLQREDWWIGDLGCLDHTRGYNCKATARHTLSAESRAKMAAYWTGRKRGPHSEATRVKLSMMKRGPSNPACRPEVRAKLSAAKKGKPFLAAELGHSPESIAKMAASKRGVPSPKRGIPISETQRLKMSAASKGKPWTPARRLAEEARRLKVADADKEA